MAAAIGEEVRPAAERLQIAQRVVAAHDHVAPVTAVAAVGAALRNVGLAPERQRAVAAGAGADLDAGAIGEHPSRVVAAAAGKVTCPIEGALPAAGNNVHIAVFPRPSLHVDRRKRRTTCEPSGRSGSRCTKFPPARAPPSMRA